MNSLSKGLQGIQTWLGLHSVQRDKGFERVQGMMYVPGALLQDMDAPCLVYVFNRGRGWGSQLSCYFCYCAIHCQDSRSEDSILERLLHWFSGNFGGHLGLEGPDIVVRSGLHHCCCHPVRRWCHCCRCCLCSGAGSHSCFSH